MSKKIEIQVQNEVEFEELVSELASGLWNELTTQPSFHCLKPADYATFFEVIKETLKRYASVTYIP